MGNSKIIYDGQTLIDLTEDSVDSNVLMEGETAHDKSGNLIIGNRKPYTLPVMTSSVLGGAKAVSATDKMNSFVGINENNQLVYQKTNYNVFSTIKSYTSEECLNFCNSKIPIVWNDQDIKESKEGKWYKDDIIILIISCDNGDNYISFQNVTADLALLPQSYWINKRGLPGQQGIPGDKPVKGNDYWTAADKQEIVNDVLLSLPKWEWKQY